MNARTFVLSAAVLTVLALAPPSARAERVRYHFAAADICGNTAQTAAGKCNAIGERVSYLGTAGIPYNGALRPTYLVTFTSPVTKGLVTVPLALPQGTPQMRYSRNRAVFDYGLYQLEVVFLPDGSVDVYYDSGPFRKLQ